MCLLCPRKVEIILSEMVFAMKIFARVSVLACLPLPSSDVVMTLNKERNFLKFLSDQKLIHLLSACKIVYLCCTLSSDSLLFCSSTFVGCFAVLVISSFRPFLGHRNLFISAQYSASERFEEFEDWNWKSKTKYRELISTVIRKVPSSTVITEACRHTRFYEEFWRKTTYF